MFKKISVLLGGFLMLSSAALQAMPQTCQGMVEKDFRNSQDFFYNISFATVTQEGVKQHGFINTQEADYHAKKIPFACGGSLLGQLRVTILAYRKGEDNRKNHRIIWSGDCLYQLAGDVVIAYHGTSEIPKKPMHESGRREFCFRAEFLQN